MSAPLNVEVGSSPFAIVPAEAFRDGRLSLRDVQILGLVCTHLNKDRICWPSQSRIAVMAQISRSVVCRSLQNLKSCGYLTMEDQYRRDGSRSTNIIRVIFSPIVAKELASAAGIALEMEQDEDTPPVHNWRTPPVHPVRPEHTPPVRPGRTPITVPSEQNNTPPSPPGGTPPKPDGLDSDAWESWIEYRRAIKKPLKPPSIPAAMAKLAEFGEDQAEVVEQSIANGWQGLFAVKNRPDESPVERVTRRYLAKRSQQAASERSALYVNTPPAEDGEANGG